MMKIDRKSFQAARRMARLLAASCPDSTENKKSCDCWEAVWGECLSGMAAQYGWPAARAISGSVFKGRDIAQKRYRWKCPERGWRFADVKHEARRKALGL